VDRGAAARETGLVAAVAAFQLFTAHAGGERFGESEVVALDALGTVLLVAGPLTLPLRRRAPLLVIAVALLAGIVYFSLGYPGSAIFATVVVALVHLARRRSVEQQLLAERERERRRVEERVALARDLHDVLAHSLSVVQVQAGVALHLLESRPENVRPALEAIKSASDEGMRELRAAVSTLRREAAPLTPTVGLEDVRTLVDSTRAVGLEVRLVRSGGVDLPARTGLVAYRVVQEALTNVVRHAHATACTVRVDTDGRVLVEVLDDGSGPVGPPGNGLSGMRERVEALGGRLEHGSHPRGGYLVRAELPL
jgi:signal transduction histidine kinase